MKNFLVKVVKKYIDARVRVYASSATFYILVSTIPVIALLFYGISSLSPHLSHELERFIASLMPGGLADSFYEIMESIKERELSSLVPFSIITSIWGSTKGINGVCHGVESIYGTKKSAGFLKRAVRTVWRGMIFFSLIFISVVVLSLGRIIYSSSQSVQMSILIELRIVAFILALTLFFSAFYARLGRGRLSQHLFGGLFSALGWTMFTYFYSIYVSYSLSTVNIYSGTGGAILYMLWSYFCVNIILIGAVINDVIREKY
ncbi:MAG: YihY/virulence factor BrkB family protein [Clostridia bacterium]|nr:YihY/virulence factor BrkB family protein [Clostridia bacterium]